MGTKLFVAILLPALVKVGSSDPIGNDDNDDDEWNQYMRRYKKTYISGAEENMRLVESSACSSLCKGEKKLDICMQTDADYRAILGFRKDNAIHGDSGNRRRKRSDNPPSMPTYVNTVDVSALNDSVNWTARGWVGPVLSQGSCGTCYAYSTTGAIEGQYKNKTGDFVELSQQNLIDCSTLEGNSGCSGGDPTNAYWYVMKYGQQTLATYPDTTNITGTAGSCAFVSSSSVVRLSGWYYVNFNDELALQQAVAYVGPISITIDAMSSNFMQYSSGIFNYSLCSSSLSDLNHSLLLVGYGTDASGTAYWLARNSWSTSWGEEGYIRIARNANNMCGVATYATFPVVKRAAKRKLSTTATTTTMLESDSQRPTQDSTTPARV